MIVFRGDNHSIGEEQEAVCVKHTSPIHLQVRGHVVGSQRLWLALLMQSSGVVEEGALYF